MLRMTSRQQERSAGTVLEGAHHSPMIFVTTVLRDGRLKGAAAMRADIMAAGHDVAAGRVFQGSQKVAVVTSGAATAAATIC